MSSKNSPRKSHVEEVYEDLIKNSDTMPDKDTSLHPFFKLLLGLVLSIIIVSWAVPHYYIKVDPSPKSIDPIDFNLDQSLIEQRRLDSIDQIFDYSMTSDVRNAAVLIASRSCTEQSQVCYAKALFYYIRDNIKYIKDPFYEYIQSPDETLLGAGDCEDQTLLLQSFYSSIGIRSQVVIYPGHAALRIQLDEAKEKYKEDDGYIYLDTTCSYCEFGERPIQYKDNILQVIG